MRKVVLASLCELANEELSFTKEVSKSSPLLVFLAMAIMAPMSAAVTNIAARQTAMKHRVVLFCHLLFVC